MTPIFLRDALINYEKNHDPRGTKQYNYIMDWDIISTQVAQMKKKPLFIGMKNGLFFITLITSQV